MSDFDECLMAVERAERARCGWCLAACVGWLVVIVLLVAIWIRS